MTTQTLVDVKPLKDFDAKEAINTLASVVQGGSMSSTVYTRYTPSSGNTITLSANTYRVIVEPATSIATLTIVLPPLPNDGDVFEIMSTQQILILNITAGNGSVRGNSFTLNPDSGASWIYRASNTTWYVRY